MVMETYLFQLKFVKITSIKSNYPIYKCGNIFKIGPVNLTINDLKVLRLGLGYIEPTDFKPHISIKEIEEAKLNLNETIYSLKNGTFFKPLGLPNYKYTNRFIKNSSIYINGIETNSPNKSYSIMNLRNNKDIVIKLGPGFSNIKEINGKIFAETAALKSKVSEFALKNSYSKFEFMSCIPGTIGGGVIMNAGCFGSEFSDMIEEVYAITLNGDEIILKKSEIKFEYRKSNINENLIILGVLFAKTKKTNSDKILEKINILKSKKKRINLVLSKQVVVHLKIQLTVQVLRPGS